MSESAAARKSDCCADASAVAAIDVGNTRAKFGLFRVTSGQLPVPLHLAACVLQSTPSLEAALKSWISDLQVGLPAVAAVAGSDPESRDQLLADWPFPDCRPVAISHCGQIPVEVDVEFPERVGIDRLLNTYAALRMAQRQQPVIVVDSGTATTVDLMTADGIFRGGSILPGLRLSAHAMHDYTARLPLLDTDQEPCELPPLPGRSTEAAMRAGLFIGQLGAVRELMAGLASASALQYRQAQPPALFVSGGGGRQLAPHLTGAQYVDSLALHGLAMLLLPQ